MSTKNVFRFKRFSVAQDLCAMKVGTDGVLLGAWADGKNCKTILDIGAGTGLLALMLAQRFPDTLIDAVEIDNLAYEECLINVCNSGFTIQAYQSDIKEWAEHIHKQYDLIVCNPPYFLHGFIVHEAARNKARVAENLSPADLLIAVKKLLAKNGKLAVIYPAEEAEKFIKHCRSQNYGCKRKTIIFSKPGQQPKRVLLEFVAYNCETEIKELLIEHEGQHNYTEEYKNLTKDFYLRF